MVVSEVRTPPAVIGGRRALIVEKEVRDQSTDKLLDAASQFQMLYLCPTLVTPVEDSLVALIDDYNDSRAEQRQTKLRVDTPARWHGKGEGLLPYYSTMVARRIVDEKTLILNGCTGGDSLKSQVPDDAGRKMVELPAACALCWAVEYYDTHTMPEWGAGSSTSGWDMGPADALGGY